MTTLYRPMAILDTCTLEELAASTYANMTLGEKMALDLRCKHLHAQLVKKRGGPFGLTVDSMREVLLAVALITEHPGNSIVKAVAAGLRGEVRG